MKAIFHRDFRYSSRRRNAGWHVRASNESQSLPREVIEAAVAAGAAEVVPPRRSKPEKPPEKPGE